MCHYVNVREIHKQELKQQEEERKLKSKAQRFSGLSMFTGGGNSNGQWPRSMMDTARQGRGRSRSRSPSYDSHDDCEYSYDGRGKFGVLQLAGETMEIEVMAALNPI